MTVNETASPLRIAAVFLAAALFASPSAADLTANDAVNRIQSWLAAQGGRFEADSVSERPDGVRLTGVRISSEGDQETRWLALEWLNLAALNDGAVAIELPEEIVAVHEDRHGTIHRRHLEIPGLGGTVSDSGAGLSLALSGPDYHAQGASKNPLTGEAESQHFSLRNWWFSVELREDSGDAPLQIALSAKELKSGISGGAVGSMDVSVAEPSISFSGQLNRLIEGQAGPFGPSPTHFSLSLASANYVSKDTAGSGPGIGLTAGPADFGYWSNADEMEVDLAIDELTTFAVLPGRVLHAAQLSEFRAETAVANRPENHTVAASLKLTVPEIVLSSDLLAVFGAGQALPPDASGLLTGKLAIDTSVEVSGELGRQFLDGQQVNSGAPGFFNWRLSELRLGFLGIELTGHGEIDRHIRKTEPFSIDHFSSDDVVGELFVEIAGVGDFLDLVAESGLIPLEIQLLLKGLAAMGNEIDDDRLGYVIQFAGTGGLFLNGTRIR